MSNQQLRVQALIDGTWRTIATESVDTMSSPADQRYSLYSLVKKISQQDSVVINNTVIFPREFPSIRVLIEDEEE